MEVVAVVMSHSSRPPLSPLFLAAALRSRYAAMWAERLEVSQFVVRLIDINLIVTVCFAGM